MSIASGYVAWIATSLGGAKRGHGVETRTLGCTGLVSSAIGLGGFGFGGAYGKADPAAAVRTIRAALDMGMTLLDAADFKAGGSVESLIGRALGRRRDDAVISARGGLRPMRSGSLIDGSPAFLTTGCHSALRRLRTGDIDLYYLAGADQKVPIEDSVGALADLVKAGLVRHIGVSVSTAAELRRAHAVHPVTAVVAEYSLLARHAERELLPAADELGVGFIACGPLGRGFLTGRLGSPGQLGHSDIRRDHPWFHDGNIGPARDRDPGRGEDGGGAGHRDVAAGPGLGAVPGCGHRPGRRHPLAGARGTERRRGFGPAQSPGEREARGALPREAAVAPGSGWLRRPGAPRRQQVPVRP